MGSYIKYCLGKIWSKIAVTVYEKFGQKLRLESMNSSYLLGKTRVKKKGKRMNVNANAIFSWIQTDVKLQAK